MCNMKKLFFFILTISLLTIGSCASKRKITGGVSQTAGVVAINEQLMCDQRELTNFNWMEYMYWTKRAYGEDSDEYKATLPDTLDWSILTCAEECNSFNYRHPNNREYPIVGISQGQAKAFSKWRSDRVFEWNLIRVGVIDYYITPMDSVHFSIENYFKGKYSQPIVEKKDTLGYKKIEPDFSIPHPVYSLPTAEQRLLILDYIDSTDAQFHAKKARRYEKWREKNVPFLLAHDPCISDSISQEVFRMVDHGLDPRNKFKLIQNSRGNAAEWGNEDGISTSNESAPFSCPNENIELLKKMISSRFRIYLITLLRPIYCPLSSS